MINGKEPLTADLSDFNQVADLLISSDDLKRVA